MAYVDAVLSVKDDRIHVVERTPDGKRAYREFPTNYTFYYSDQKGKYRSIYGDPISRFSTRKKAEFEKERRIHANKTLFESDVPVVFRWGKSLLNFILAILTLKWILIKSAATAQQTIRLTQ